MDLRLDYAMNEGEMGEAVGVVRRFRYGGGKGLFLYLIAVVIVVGLGVMETAGEWLGDPQPGPREMALRLVVSGAFVVILVTVLVVSFVRGVTVRSRSEIGVGEVAIVRLTGDHLEVKGEGGRRSWLWSHFATVLESEGCLLVMGVDSFLPIPKRVLVGVELGDLRVVLEELVVKRARSEGFEVVMGEKLETKVRRGEWFREEEGRW